MYSICFLYCVLGEETVNVHVRVSDGDDITFSDTTQNDNPTISPSQPTMTTNDEENQQELDNVYNTTTTIGNLLTKETEN